MLAALQAQVEAGDLEENIVDYRVIASHCLPTRLVPNISYEAVMKHHQILGGMTSTESKKAFLNLIRSWPLHRATIFDVMVTFYILFTFSHVFPLFSTSCSKGTLQEECVLQYLCPMHCCSKSFWVEFVQNLLVGGFQCVETYSLVLARGELEGYNRKVEWG